MISLQLVYWAKNKKKKRRKEAMPYIGYPYVLSILFYVQTSNRKFCRLFDALYLVKTQKVHYFCLQPWWLNAGILALFFIKASFHFLVPHSYTVIHLSHWGSCQLGCCTSVLPYSPKHYTADRWIKTRNIKSMYSATVSVYILSDVFPGKFRMVSSWMYKKALTGTKMIGVNGNGRLKGRTGQ